MSTIKAPESKAKKNKGGATGALDSLLGEMQLDKAAPQVKIIEANTAECRMWRFADRPSEEAEHIEEIAESIRLEGQIQPAVARPCDDPDAPNIKYEIIVGNVRFQACKSLAITLRLEVKSIDDLAANRIMFDENEKRKGISVYARSLHLARCLDEGLYESKKALSGHLAISPSTLSYHLAFATLPDSIVQALGNMRNITLAMGYRIAQALEKLTEEDVLELVPSIKAGELSAAQLEALVVRPTEKPIEEPAQHPVSPIAPIASGTLIEHMGQSENPEPDYDPEDDQGENDDFRSNATQSFEEQSGNAKTARPEKQAKLSLGQESDENGQNKSAPANESDLDRANKLGTRICDRISVVWVADSGTSDNAVIKLSIHSALADFLIKNQGYLQNLMSKLKEEAALSLINEVPLDIFDNAVTNVITDDSQVDWTE